MGAAMPTVEVSGATLLMVDDQPRKLRLVSAYLAENGFELVPTRSGEQA